MVGFTPADINLGLEQLNVDLPDLEGKAEAVTKTDNNYVVSGKEVTYNIIIKNNKKEKLNQIEVSTLIPEGTELVEGTISDNGTVENGKIIWKVDINDEKTVSFTVKVTKTEGNIELVAIVNGKETNTVINKIDKAPVLTVVDPNRYQMEVGTEYKEKGYTAIDEEDGDITNKVVLTYRFLPVGSSNWTDPEVMDTSLLGTYKITYTVTDSAGNTVSGTRVVETVDTTAPKIIVKDGYVGNKDKKVFSNVSFKLYDNYGVSAFKINDGKWIERTVNQWSDANFDNIKNMLVYGKNTITLKDVSGNETTYEFVYDNVKPTITVKDGYVGNKDKNVYSNVSFSLYDEYEVIAYKINDGQYGEFTINQWSDANFDNIKDRLVYGKNTITLKDVAGNEETYTFTYDNVAPEVDKIQLINLDNTNSSYIKNKQEVRFNVTFKEEITTLPVLTIGNQTANFEKMSGGNGEVIYQADLVIDASKNVELKEGILAFTITGYKDVAGNEGIVLTEANARNTLIFDKTKPVVTGISDGTCTRQDVILNIDDVNPGTIHLHKNGELVKNYKPGKAITEEGTYTVYASDLAGNKSETITFIIDKTMPVVKGVENGAYYNHDVTIEIIEEHLQNAKIQKDGGKWQSITSGTTISEEGTYFLRVTDQAYNKKAEITFTIDKTAPTATLTYSNDNGNALTNQDVTVTLVGSEPLQDIEGWNRVDDKTFRKVYSVGAKYTVEIKDLAGNTATIYNEVKRLDKVAPTAEVTYSNNNGASMTNKDVTVTLTANESIRDIEGWTRVDDKTFTKVYSDNGKFSVEITDKAGNTSTVYYEVKRIDKVAPVITLPTDNTFEVGVDVYSYPEAGSVYDAFDKEISFKEVNIEWFKANADGSKGEKVANFEWDTTLANRELGKYYIEYWVSDKAGNIARAHRILTLQDTTAPTVTLNGEAEMKVSQGAEFIDPGVTVKDNIEGEIEQSTIVYYSETGKDGTWTNASENKVDTSKLGYYAIWYVATDKQGNSSDSVRRIVHVADTTIPTATVTYDPSGEMARKVTVTVTSTEPIEFIDAGYWEDKGNNVYKKVYPYNSTETVKFKDASGNIGSVNIVINNVDNKGPKAEVSQSKDDKEEGKVWITLAFDEKIANISSLKENGWTEVSGKENTYHKAYYRAKSDKVTVKDVLGNESTIEFTVEM